LTGELTEFGVHLGHLFVSFDADSKFGHSLNEGRRPEQAIFAASWQCGLCPAPLGTAEDRVVTLGIRSTVGSRANESSPSQSDNKLQFVLPARETKFAVRLVIASIYSNQKIRSALSA